MADIRKIELARIEANQGQIPGVPANPRTWETQEMERLKKSLKETPELTEARGLLVYQVGKRFVIIGGNMRYQAAKALGWEDITCEVLPKETTPEKLMEMVIKDNGSSGRWDMDALANEWPDGKLAGWGVRGAWSLPEKGWQQETASTQEPETEMEDFEHDFGGGDTGKVRERIIITYPKDMTQALEKILGTKIDPEKIVVKVEDL